MVKSSSHSPTAGCRPSSETWAPAHLAGQSIGLPGCQLLFIERVPKHAAQGGCVLWTEEKPAVVVASGSGGSGVGCLGWGS